MDLRGKTVAVDFDGVLHSYTSGWTGLVPIDGPNEGAAEFIENLLAHNARVVIFTTRASDPAGLRAIYAWLTEHGFPSEVFVTHEKPKAIAYIDDRAVPFRCTPAGHGNWDECLAQVEALLE